jgi:hypothetical protein
VLPSLGPPVVVGGGSGSEDTPRGTWGGAGSGGFASASGGGWGRGLRRQRRRRRRGRGGNHEGGFTEEEDAGRFREWMKEGDDVGPTHDLL